MTRLNLSTRLKTIEMLSQTLCFYGDAAYYRGDLKSAGDFYKKALEAANRSKNLTKFSSPRYSIWRKSPSGRTRATGHRYSLRPLLQQAESLGLKYMQVDGSISLAEARMQTHDSAHAQQELERALIQADKLGLKPQSARAHYLLAAIFHAAGNQVEAQQQARGALQFLEVMRKDPGAEKILQRSDFKAIMKKQPAGRKPPRAKQSHFLTLAG